MNECVCLVRFGQVGFRMRSKGQVEWGKGVWIGAMHRTETREEGKIRKKRDLGNQIALEQTTQ